ncbi:MAG: nuclear transport factor 2 family protein [Armatimonadetes bacterium]|nr:nuclear transport factor 2 family protein [Armatimonadota bacterium]
MNGSTTAEAAETLRRAIEQNDAPLLASLYAPHADLRVIDRSHTPSAPLEIQGQAAIRRFYDDICGRAMTHRIEQAVVGTDSLAFTEVCEYPSGSHVYCAAMLQLQDGKIIHQVNVQAWDE